MTICTAGITAMLCLATLSASAQPQPPTGIGPGRPGFDPNRFAGSPPSPTQAPCVTGLVYDNLATPLGNYLGGFAYEEVGDDVTLDGSGLFRSATVAYAGFNFDGNETLTLNLYNMDGAPTPGSFGFNTPGTLLFSQTIGIPATAGSTVTFGDSLVPSIPLSGVIGVGLVFAGVDFDPTGAGSDAGPLLYDPPVTGASLDDFWLRGFPNAGDPWGLYTFGGSPPINLGIQIETVCPTSVPEPGTWWNLLLGGLALAGIARMKRQGV